MKMVLINGLLLCLVFMLTSAATGSEPGPDVSKNESRDGIQLRRKACRNLGGRCVKNKRDCPKRLPLKTQPGRPHCSSKRRCCYPEELDVQIVETTKCGLGTPAEASQRVINGNGVYDGKYSWQVGLKDDLDPWPQSKYYCGGSIINDQYILTAAHCFVKRYSDGQCREYKPPIVYVGIGNVYQDERTIFRKAPAGNIMIHYLYLCNHHDFDIALIKLTETISQLIIDGIVVPICLATNAAETYAGKHAIVSGWGSVRGYNPPPPSTPTPIWPKNLIEAIIPVISNDDCEKNVKGLTIRMICGSTGDEFSNGGKEDWSPDACSGDSGGPLTYKVDKSGQQSQREQIGIVSFGDGCGSRGHPGVYARVTEFIPWIKRVAGTIYTIPKSTTK